MVRIGQHVLEYVDSYLHGALDAIDAKVVAAHCEHCAICKVALDEARKRMDLMSTLPHAEASEELIQSVERRANVYRSRPLPRRTADWLKERSGIQKTWIVAGLVLLMLAAAQGVVSSRSPSPFDLRVLGQSELLAESDASLRVLVVHNDSDRPVPNVPVTVELHGNDNHPTVQLASFKTDAAGTGSPRVHLPDWSSGAYTLRVVAHTSGGEQEISETVKLTRSWRLMLSTDKPVYQPGQTIHVRSLALRRPDLKPIAGNDVQFTITDPKGNRIFRHGDVTSRFGIASIDCPLATEILEGSYKVDCTVGDVTSTRTVEVKKYTLPKFKVDVTLDAPYYKPGDMIRGTVEARYFFGKPVANGTVEVSLQTFDVSPASPSTVELKTDTEGKAALSLRVPESLVGREQNSGDARVVVHATVTDSASQKETKSVSRVVTVNPIHIDVIPESGKLVENIANIVYLIATYADGRPAKARIAISGNDQELATDALGVATVELTPRTGPVRWNLRATDEQGLSGRREVTLELGNARDDFLVRPDRAVCTAGETLALTALSSGDEPIFIDLIKDGQTVLTDRIIMVDGKGAYGFDLPADLFGTIELLAYRYDDNGLPVKKSRALYVRQADSLQIQTSLDRKEYRPGESARLNVRLVDANGKPKPGAVSLSAVDEAVYSVLEQAPGMEQTFFTLEQEILKPVYAIYPWSAAMRVPGTLEERRRFEQALFSTTASKQVERTRDRRVFANAFDESDGRVVVNPFGEPDSPALSSKSASHALQATTHAENVRATAARKRANQKVITPLWIGAAIVCVFILLNQIVAWMIGRYSVWSSLVIVVVGAIGVLAIVLEKRLAPEVKAVLKKTETKSEAKSEFQFTTGTLMPASSDLEFTLADGAVRFASENINFAAQPTVRVREWFPETLLWRPELITDNEGQTSIDLPLADSITTWRVNASAVTAAGELGGSESSIRVFQPFFVDLNLPVALTRGDEVAVPIVVYNYLDKPQTVKLGLKSEPWFELLEEADKSVDLAPGEVRSASYRLRVKRVGKHQLQVAATAGEIVDAIRRDIEVVPDGRRVEQVVNGTLSQPQSVELAVPANAVEGSTKAIVKIYPTTFSQLLEGLDAIFQMPSGCFEQTSSTTYPNVLALEYLRRTQKSVPAVEAKAKQFIHLGYQRLLSFEIDGGGFDWFGHPPANRTLTAYGLMEFDDMALVHDVDPSLIFRTRDWLLKQRQPDGSWEPEGHQLHDDPTRGNQETARLSTTAYIAWAVYNNWKERDTALVTKRYLESQRPESISDPYTLALVCNALLAMHDSPNTPKINAWLDRLLALKRTSSDSGQTWWETAPASRTAFFGAGQSADVEATALAALAFLKSGRDAGVARGALTWLVSQKDGAGMWRSTQATVLALKALLEGTGKALGGDTERRIVVTLDDKPLEQIVIPVDQAEVMRQIDLSPRIDGGTHRLRLADQTGQSTMFQSVFSYHVPEDGSAPPPQQPLAISISYDRKSLSVNETLTATAQIANNMKETAPMVIVNLPIPAGFEMRVSDLDELVRLGRIAKLQITPRSALLYLRALEPGEPLEIRYRLHATMPVKLRVPAAVAYEYYDPAKRATSATAEMTVTAGG